MTTPRTRQAYLAIYEIFDQALASEAGIRMTVESEAAATHLRLRMHAGRAVDREYNASIYEQGDNLWWASIYDVLEIRIRAVGPPDGEYHVLIEPRIPKLIGKIEAITPNPKDTEWRQPSLRQIDTTLAEPAPSFLPNTGSHTGTKLLTKSSESTSDAPNDDSSSTPSTKPEPEPAIRSLRRL